MDNPDATRACLKWLDGASVEAWRCAGKRVVEVASADAVWRELARRDFYGGGDVPAAAEAPGGAPGAAPTDAVTACASWRAAHGRWSRVAARVDGPRAPSPTEAALDESGEEPFAAASAFDARLWSSVAASWRALKGALAGRGTAEDAAVGDAIVATLRPGASSEDLARVRARSLRYCYAMRDGRAEPEVFDPTSMWVYSNVSTQALSLCSEHSTRALDSSKSRPNRRRRDRARAVRSLVATQLTV